jgi:hypothetical protein
LKLDLDDDIDDLVIVVLQPATADEMLLHETGSWIVIERRFEFNFSRWIVKAGHGDGSLSDIDEALDRSISLEQDRVDNALAGDRNEDSRSIPMKHLILKG